MDEIVDENTGTLDDAPGDIGGQSLSGGDPADGGQGLDGNQVSDSDIEGADGEVGDDQFTEAIAALEARGIEVTPEGIMAFLEKYDNFEKTNRHAQQKISEQGAEIGYARKLLQEMGMAPTQGQGVAGAAPVPGSAEAMSAAEEALQKFLDDPNATTAQIARAEAEKMFQEREARTRQEATFNDLTETLSDNVAREVAQSLKMDDAEFGAVLAFCNENPALTALSNVIDFDGYMEAFKDADPAQYEQIMNNQVAGMKHLMKSICELGALALRGKNADKLITDNGIKARREATISALRKSKAGQALRPAANRSKPLGRSSGGEDVISYMNRIAKL